MSEGNKVKIYDHRVLHYLGGGAFNAPTSKPSVLVDYCGPHFDVGEGPRRFEKRDEIVRVGNGVRDFLMRVYLLNKNTAKISALFELTDDVDKLIGALDSGAYRVLGIRPIIEISRSEALAIRDVIKALVREVVSIPDTTSNTAVVELTSDVLEIEEVRGVDDLGLVKEQVRAIFYNYFSVDDFFWFREFLGGWFDNFGNEGDFVKLGLELIGRFESKFPNGEASRFSMMGDNEKQVFLKALMAAKADLLLIS